MNIGKYYFIDCNIASIAACCRSILKFNKLYAVIIFELYDHFNIIKSVHSDIICETDLV